MPLGREILLMCLPAGRQSRVEKRISSRRAQLPIRRPFPCCTTLVLKYPKRKKRRRKSTMWELLVYMCFELRLIHTWKAINLQRPQKTFF